MNNHENLIRDSADLGEALLEPLTAAGIAAMLQQVDAIAARLAAGVMPASQPA